MCVKNDKNSKIGAPLDHLIMHTQLKATTYTYPIFYLY